MRRRIVMACVVIAAASAALNTALIVSGHPARFGAAAIVCGALGLVSGLLYLHSTRGRS